MAERLSDEELIFLVQQKTPEELTLEELTQLRERLRDSVDLRSALDGTLFIESRLNLVLTEIQIPVESILKRAQELEQQNRGRIPRWLLWPGLASLLLSFIGLMAWTFLREPNGGARPDDLAVDATSPNVSDARSNKGNLKALARNDGVTDPTNGMRGLREPATDQPRVESESIPTDLNLVEAPRPLESLEVTGAAARDASRGPWTAELDPERPPLPLAATTFHTISRTFPADFLAGDGRRRGRGGNRPPIRPADPVLGGERKGGHANAPGDNPELEIANDGMGSEPISLALLKEALATVPGKPLRLFEAPVGKTKIAGFEGMARLQTVWPTDGVLRMSLVDPAGFRMHFWTGETGVTAQFFEQGRPAVWGIYRGSRSAGMPQPAKISLETTDDARHFRSGLGLFEVRWQKGELLLTRGDVRLMSVPLSSPPTEIYFEGRATFSLLTMFRSELFHAASPNPRRVILKSPRPAELKWTREVETADEFQASADGRVSLAIPAATVDMATGRMKRPERWAGTSLGRPGLYEVIVRVDEADPGTGIYLGSLEGEPIHHVGFFRDRKTQQTTFGFGWTKKGYVMSPNIRVDVDEDGRTWPAAWAGDPQWLRIVVGLNGVAIWTSGDGVHWGRSERAISRQEGGSFASVGLYALASDKPRHIRLGYLEIRELTALRSLAREDLRQKVSLPAEVDKLDFGGWFEHLLRTRPAGVGLEEWRLASAVQTLESDPPQQLGMTLLKGLIEAGLRQKRSATERYDLLDEVALLIDDGPASTELRLFDRYEELADLLHDERAPRPFERTISRRIESSPPNASSQQHALSAQFIRSALLAHLSSHDWGEARRLASQFEFWLNSDLPSARLAPAATAARGLITWGEAISVARMTGEKGVLADNSPLLGQPLAARLNRDAFNVMAEFESAIAGRSFKDAARIISSTTTTSAQGLVPDARDPLLLVSFPRAVAGAMRDHPQLLTAMQEEFGRLGLLRVRQSIAEAQVDTVEALTIQFYGTEAAAEAHRWLGDRWLAAGKFGQAVEHYLTARRSLASASNYSDLDARIRLASALLGIAPPLLNSESRLDVEGGSDNSGLAGTNHASNRVADGSAKPSVPKKVAGDATIPMPSGPINFGGEAVPAGEFEDLLKGLQTRSKTSIAAPLTAAGPNQTVTTVPALQPQRAETRLPSLLTSSIIGPVSFPRVDQDAVQTAMLSDAATVYLGNRIDWTAYDVASGKIRWTVSPPKETVVRGDWPLSSMGGTVDGQRLFVRRLRRTSSQNEVLPELLCLEKSSGKILWTLPTTNEILASDPVLIRSRLLVVVTSRSGGDLVHVATVSLDLDSGAVLSREPVTSLRTFRNGKLSFDVREHEGRLLIAGQGIVACCDFFGRTRWVRSQLRIPPEYDVSSAPQLRSVPRVVGKMMVVAQPHVRAVEAIDIESGRLQWRQSASNLIRTLDVIPAEKSPIANRFPENSPAERDNKQLAPGVAARGETASILIQTEQGFAALSATDGRTLWQHAASHDHLTESYLVDRIVGDAAPNHGPGSKQAGGDPPTLFYVSRHAVDSKSSSLVLTWLNARTGVLVARQVVTELTGPAPQLGPMLTVQGRYFGLFRPGGATTQSLVELLPQGNVPQVAATRLVTSNALTTARMLSWNEGHDEGVSPGIPAEPFRNWQFFPMSSHPLAITGPLPQRGEPLAWKTTVPAGGTFRAFRQVRVPSEGKPRFVVRAGCEAKVPWNLAISINGRMISLQTVDDVLAPAGWRDFEVDLTPWRNEVIWIGITQTSFAPRQGSTAWWQRLELKP